MKPMKQIKVIVAGVSCAGKSTIATLIQEALNDKGIAVYVTDGDSSGEIDKNIQELRVNAVKDGTIVNVVTKNVSK